MRLTPEDDENPIDLYECYDYIKHYLGRVTAREKTVLFNIFYNDKTLEQCGEEFGVTARRARQIRDMGLRKIRRMIRVDQVKLEHGVIFNDYQKT